MLISCRHAFIACAILGAEPVLANVVEWSNLSTGGNGCPAGSAVITVTPDGNELSWTSDKFGFELSGESAATRFCRLSASAKVAKGYYLSSIRQHVGYGAAKTKSGSEFSIGAQARFFGHDLTPLTRKYSEGSDFTWSKVTLYRTQDFTKLAPNTFFCNGENSDGLFQGTVSSTARVSSPEGKVSVGIQGVTVSYRAIFNWLPCPS